ncbi:hypothetical protein M8845_18685 [Gelidibacter japonicus]|uniref:hypothetical protein n=1 Tax=Gelidibacter japonicus TaxID=1962232 RepID=UPI002020F40D|nr:hypothetical protein [Gelidibacter japonicus]MCL8009454.1 hypothetical protein [Gelidibacter japonicus]
MKTNILLSLIILFLTNYMHSQDKSFKNTSIDFVIKKRHLVSSKYTDAENNKEHGGTFYQKNGIQDMCEHLWAVLLAVTVK